MKKTIMEFRTSITIMSNNGSCFIDVRRKTPTKSLMLYLLEVELLDHGIEFINTYHAVPRQTTN